VAVEGSSRGATEDRTIRLAVPAAAEYGRVARTTAAGLALRLGFSYRAIEDLRLAVDETLILLLRPDGAGESVEFDFDPGDGVLVMEATLDPPGLGIDPTAIRRFERLVKPIVDDWSVDDAGRVRLVKRGG
jgi:hypothetical protein